MDHMIEVTNYYEETRDDKKYLYADVVYKGVFIIRRLCHLYNEKGNWFNWASFTRPQTDGSKKYLAYCEFVLPAHNGEFFEQLSSAVKRFKEKNNIQEAASLEDMPF